MLPTAQPRSFPSTGRGPQHGDRLQSHLRPLRLVVTQVEAAAPSLKPANLTFTTVINGTTYSGTTCATNSLTTGASNVLGHAFMDPVTVVITYPCELMTKFYGTGNYFNCTLTASMTEVVQ